MTTRQTRNQAGLTPKQLSKFRDELIDRITTIYRAVHSDLRDQLGVAFSDREAEGPHDEVDESLRVQLQDLRELLDEREAQLAQSMEAALARIVRGDFGMCEACGQPIDLERLELVPWTTRCLEDQEAVEHEHPRPSGL